MLIIKTDNFDRALFGLDAYVPLVLERKFLYLCTGTQGTTQRVCTLVRRVVRSRNFIYYQL